MERINYGCFEFCLNGCGHLVLLKCRSEESEVFVPASVHGKEVVQIEKKAFAGCENLQTVVLPDSVVKIGQKSFMGCFNLKELFIPDSVCFIGAKAFEGCKKLKDVFIPNSVATIGAGAFSGCDSLETALIYGCPTIGHFAFPKSALVLKE